MLFFCNASTPTEISTLSLHDALPIWTYLDWLGEKRDWCISRQLWWGHRIPIWYTRAPEAELKRAFAGREDVAWRLDEERSEEHTSELQSREKLVCRLLLEKKKPKAAR